MDESRLSKIAHELWQHHQDLEKDPTISKAQLQKYADKFDCSMETLIMALEWGAHNNLFHHSTYGEDNFLNDDWKILSGKDGNKPVL